MASKAKDPEPAPDVAAVPEKVHGGLPVQPSWCKDMAIQVQGGKWYSPAKARLLWFRYDHPTWGIQTNPIQIDVQNKVAIFHATITDENGTVLAQGTKMESKFQDFVGKAETGAIGRALTVLGYATENDRDFDDTEEVDPAIIDRQPAPHSQAAKSVQNGQPLKPNGNPALQDKPISLQRVQAIVAEAGKVGLSEQELAEHVYSAYGAEVLGQMTNSEANAVLNWIKDRPGLPTDATGQQTLPVGVAACSECSRPLTKGQTDYSTAKFGRPLCPTHQAPQNAQTR